jgi:hypothetical protein
MLPFCLYPPRNSYKDFLTGIFRSGPKTTSDAGTFERLRWWFESENLSELIAERFPFTEKTSLFWHINATPAADIAELFDHFRRILTWTADDKHCIFRKGDKLNQIPRTSLDACTTWCTFFIIKFRRPSLMWRAPNLQAWTQSRIQTTICATLNACERLAPLQVWTP